MSAAMMLGPILNTITSPLQRNFQLKMEDVRNKNQIANSLRQYKLNNAWPLDTTPEDIAETILGMPGNVPIYLIIATISNTSSFQQALSDVWCEISNFFTSTFSVNSDAPIVIGKYKTNVQNSSPTHDYMTLFSGLKSVPTLFVAPFSTMKDSILGITIAFWGIDDEQMVPVVQNIEIDVRKLYIDEIRKESVEFIKRCKSGMLNPQDYPQLANNVKIFAAEKKMFDSGNDFAYLDKTLAFYKDVVPSTSVFFSMMKQIAPLLKLVTSYIADTYFVLQYGTAPRLPRIVNDIKNNGAIPDLSMRGFMGENEQFTLFRGTQFIEDALFSYADIVGNNVVPVSGIKCLPYFTGSSQNTKKHFEHIILEKYFPHDMSMTDYSNDQHNIIKQISQLPEIQNSEKISILVMEWRKFIANLPENNDSATVAIHSPDELYQKAKILMEEKQISQAIEILEQIAEEIPQAAYDLGEIYSNGVVCGKDLKKAVKYLEIAYKKGIKNYAKLANCKKQNGAHPSEYRQVLFEGVNAGDDISACQLALEYVKEKDFSAAKKVLALPLKKGSSEAQKILLDITKKSIGSFFSKFG